MRNKILIAILFIAFIFATIVFIPRVREGNTGDLMVYIINCLVLVTIYFNFRKKENKK